MPRLIYGWHKEDADEARLFANRLMSLTSDYSRWLDLSKLLRIILSYDHRGAFLLETVRWLFYVPH